MQPKFIDWSRTLVLKLVCPFSTVFVLGIFPFWADAFLEQVVIGFKSKFGDGTDIILRARLR